MRGSRPAPASPSTWNRAGRGAAGRGGMLHRGQVQFFSSCHPILHLVTVSFVVRPGKQCTDSGTDTGFADRGNANMRQLVTNHEWQMPIDQRQFLTSFPSTSSAAFCLFRMHRVTARDGYCRTVPCHAIYSQYSAADREDRVGLVLGS